MSSPRDQARARIRKRIGRALAAQQHRERQGVDEHADGDDNAREPIGAAALEFGESVAR